MINRKRKKAIILGVYLVFLAAIVWMIAAWVRPAPTCTDGVRNQDEIGVDCGGICGACAEKIVAQPITVSLTQAMHTNVGSVDAVARIKNPNARYGSARVQYRFTIKGLDDVEMGTREGETFILPSEEKYVLEQNIMLSDAMPVIVTDFVVTDVTWQVFEGFEEPRITVVNKRFDLSSNTVSYAQAYGLVRNESPYDFRNIVINIVLRDAAGTPLAIHKTEMDTLNAGVSRDFTAPWPQRFDGDVAAYDVEVEANVFNNDNFRRRYLPNDTFQSWQ